MFTKFWHKKSIPLRPIKGLFHTSWGILLEFPSILNFWLTSVCLCLEQGKQLARKYFWRGRLLALMT